MNSLRKTYVRAAAVLAVAVLGLSVLVQGSLLAFADQPLANTLEINDTSTTSSLCGFPITMHEEGTLRTALYFNHDGQVVRITNNWQGVQSTLTNPENGNSLSYVLAGRSGFTMSTEGGETVFTRGVRGIVTVPGSGAISGQAGNVTIHLAEDGSIEVHQSGFLEGGDFAPACTYLQGTP